MGRRDMHAQTNPGRSRFDPDVMRQISNDAVGAEQIDKSSDRFARALAMNAVFHILGEDQDEQNGQQNIGRLDDRGRDATSPGGQQRGWPRRRSSQAS
jgi:hypothetical protein